MRSRKRRRHGLSKTYFQTTLDGMRGRCLDPNHRNYANYGGRGIGICDRWLFGNAEMSAVECFATDMGERPTAYHSVDRIDIHGDYEPSNCRWSLVSYQNRTKRGSATISAALNTFSVKQLCRERGVPYSRVAYRLRRGWPLDAAMREPVHGYVPTEATLAVVALSIGG